MKNCDIGSLAIIYTNVCIYVYIFFTVPIKELRKSKLVVFLCSPLAYKIQMFRTIHENSDSASFNKLQSTFWRFSRVKTQRVGACCCFSPVWLFVIPWSVAHQASLFMGFSRQEYWSGLSCPFPGDLPDPQIEPASLMSPALVGSFFTPSATREGTEF